MSKRLLVLSIGLVGVSLTGEAQETLTTAPQSSVLSAPGGQFVFGQINEYRRDRFMLDTKTGRLWAVVVDKNEVTKLQPVMYILPGLNVTTPMPYPEAEAKALQKIIMDLARTPVEK